MKTYGNLATVPKPKTRTRQIKRKIVHKKGLPVKEKLLYLGTVILFVLVTSVVLSNQAKLTEINVEIQQLEQQMTQVEADIVNLEAEARKLRDPERIKRMARELGMELHPQNVRTTETRDIDTLGES